MNNISNQDSNFNFNAPNNLNKPQHITSERNLLFFNECKAIFSFIYFN